MARRARIIGRETDVWGDEWDVRERRDGGAVPVALGWPEGARRGKGGAGGPRVIVTRELADHFERHRARPQDLGLPVGASAIKRVRRLLGHHRQIDRAAWWAERMVELCDLPVSEFAARHAVAIGAVSQARAALFGAKLRPPGWWREPDVAAVLTADEPCAMIADEVALSVGAVRRLRAVLRAEEGGG